MNKMNIKHKQLKDSFKFCHLKGRKTVVYIDSTCYVYMHLLWPDLKLRICMHYDFLCVLFVFAQLSQFVMEASNICYYSTRWENEPHFIFMPTYTHVPNSFGLSLIRFTSVLCMVIYDLTLWYKVRNQRPTTNSIRKFTEQM